MNSILKVCLIALILSSTLSLFTYSNDSTSVKSKTKSGWSFGAVPVVAYDTDIGFKYGALANVYHYGDGSIYPDYKHSIFFEWSRTTKGSGINQIIYDSKYLIPGIRVSGELSYLTEQSLDFYGYNGYKAYYNKDFEDDSPENNDYRSRMFYRQDRKLLRLRADFGGSFKPENLGWILGAVHYNVKLDTVDIDRLNKGQSDEDKLPAIDGGLYGDYGVWGVTNQDQYLGGQSTLLKAGLVYDSRDNEPNPMSGIWTDILFLLDPGFGNSYTYSKFAITHRQYFTLVPDQLSFAYRLAYQGTLFGTTPSYMTPFVFNSGRSTDRDGLGGSKTLRGIIRNRVVGEDIALGNFELRWKFLRTVVLNQNIYLALSAFTDMGMVTKEYEINTENVTEPIFFPDTNEGLHQSVGAGFRFALNENFVVAVDYGVALNEQDGDNGLYIHMNWLF